MAEIKAKGKRPVVISAARPMGLGDVFQDRLAVEWPRMWGWEISEEEYCRALEEA